MLQNHYAKAEELLKEFEEALKAAPHLSFKQVKQVLDGLYDAFARERKRVYEKIGWMPEGFELLGRSAFLGVRSRDGREILATDFEDPWFDGLTFITHRIGIVDVPKSAPSLQELKERLAGIEPGFDLGSIRRVPYRRVRSGLQICYLQARREQPLLTAVVLQEIRRHGHPVCFEELLGCAEAGTMNTWHPTVGLGSVLPKNGTQFVPALDFAGNYFAPPALRFFDRQGPWARKTRFPFVPN